MRQWADRKLLNVLIVPGLGLAAASACGSSWTFLFTFLNNLDDIYSRHAP